MKIYKLIPVFAISFLLIIACKSETKINSNTVITVAKTENISLVISGMTCEIGCAKTIQSKLSKKEGVTAAKVVFTDSIANITFDANVTSKTALISFVNGIAGGDLYTASEIILETK